ncbi:MAG: hypothetical protein ACREMD_04230, partial [Gemmatimonadota bacterium]
MPQFSISGDEDSVTYSWDNSFQIRTGDTLHLRVVEINVSSEPMAPELACDIVVETELELAPSGKHCSVSPGLLAPGDSAWTWSTTVVRSPPGEYAFAWGAGGLTSPGTIQILEASPESGRRTWLQGRIPFVLELVGEEASLHSARDIEMVAQGALWEGARRAVVFRVDEAAAERMKRFTPVLRLTFDFNANGEMKFSRCWEGTDSTSLLSHLCGDVSRGSFGSDLTLGARIHHLLL